MPLLQERKQEIIAEYQKHSNDNGSATVQVAMITDRINQISAHLKLHNKDFSSRRSLMKLIGQRKRLLAYIRSHSVETYRELTTKLKIRG